MKTTQTTETIDARNDAGRTAEVIAHPATVPVDIPAHPSLGAAGDTVVTPISATIYQVSRGDRILGFVEGAGALWVALQGSVYAWSVEVGQFHALGPAMRELAEASDDIPDNVSSIRRAG
ncbi:hypothetical protein [Schumannella sp. 10F1B-5-1]|uniref:hypothetical protein n=1 Tax=Schumannella sp. 10F1B-5-1 TaxID=2590780 RepID=UPI001130957E|nr:hypothetical protein [Schumannella sp. 10F1B-5-1]TPW76957.1 hypothetical protein FJ658_03280 [Schumannella sp. 10F1B-5-1]